MPRFTITIAGIPSDAIRGAAARIIATSPGFILSEPEALELLEALPLALTFEAERQQGEETLKRLGQAGCELSYETDSTDNERPQAPKRLDGNKRLDGKMRLEEDYNIDQLEIVEAALVRMPRILWGLFAWTFVIALQALIAETWLVILGCSLLLVFFAFAAIGAASQELWGYVFALAGAAFATLTSWGLLAHVLFLIINHRIGRELGQVGPILVFNWALFFSIAIPFCLCIHIVFTLLKKPVRRWFS